MFIASAPTATKERTSEFELNRTAICRWIKERHGYLVSACTLGVVFHPRISPKAIYMCEPKHVRFLIEPPMEEGRSLDLAKEKWNTWTSSDYKTYSRDANELGRVVI